MNASLLLPLVAAVFLAASASAASNQTASALGDQRDREPTDAGKSYDDPIKALKEKYRDQKTAIAGAGPAASASQAPNPPQSREHSIGEIEAMLLRLPYCRKDPQDTAELAPALKGKIGLVTCSKDPASLEAFVIVPRSVRPEQQLMYAAPPGLKFLRARLVDHFLVLQFDTQTHYLDVSKPSPTGFAQAGYSAGPELAQFTDLGMFTDALKSRRGVRSDLLAKLPALVAKAAGGESYRLSAREHQGEWTVVVALKAGATRVWPETKTP